MRASLENHSELPLRVFAEDRLLIIESAIVVPVDRFPAISRQFSGKLRLHRIVATPFLITAHSGKRSSRPRQTIKSVRDSCRECRSQDEEERLTLVRGRIFRRLLNFPGPGPTSPSLSRAINSASWSICRRFFSRENEREEDAIFVHSSSVMHLGECLMTEVTGRKSSGAFCYDCKE